MAESELSLLGSHPQSLLHTSGKEGPTFFSYVQVPIPDDLTPCQALASSSVLSNQLTIPLSPKSCPGYPSRVPSTSSEPVCPMPPCRRKEVRMDLLGSATFKHSSPKPSLINFSLGPQSFLPVSTFVTQLLDHELSSLDHVINLNSFNSMYVASKIHLIIC